MDDLYTVFIDSKVRYFRLIRDTWVCLNPPCQNYKIILEPKESYYPLSNQLSNLYPSGFILE